MVVYKEMIIVYIVICVHQLSLFSKMIFVWTNVSQIIMNLIRHTSLIIKL
jgi:hypothetical protein